MCEALGIDFETSMLTWPTGKRDSDGVWANHWYHSVEKSTGFASVAKSPFTLNQQQLTVVEEVTPYYEKLKAHAV